MIRLSDPSGQDTAMPAVIPSAMPAGIAIPEIYLPRPGTDLMRWSVIACDQHTSQAAYWQETAQFVADAPSTLNLILPEIYLEHPEQIPIADRISQINGNMRRYLEEGLLTSSGHGCVAVVRSTPQHPSRKGLVLAIDLECYDFTPGNHQPIRATEGTVLERIPPRMAIRREAWLELPHVQLLIDDPHFSVIDPLLSSLQAENPEPLYATDLMQQGGSVKGWFVPASSSFLKNALSALARLGSSDNDRDGLLMVVGDGNHSLAAAKAHWDRLKHDASPDHPARFALVEVVNLHDEGLAFEPIHRVVFDVESAAFLDHIRHYFAGQDMRLTPEPDGLTLSTSQTLSASRTHAAGHRIPVLTPAGRWLLDIRRPTQALAAAAIQDFLDDLVRQAEVRIDYIHGADALADLVRQNGIGLILPAMDKNQLFPGIVRDGLLPRKTFSMGDANEKRYYMECRKIR